MNFVAAVAIASFLAASVPAAPVTADPLGAAARSCELPVTALKGDELLGIDGAELGEIEGVVESRVNGKQFLVVEREGFLGLFKSKVAVPVARVAWRDGQLVAWRMSREQLEMLPRFDNDGNAFRELDEADRVVVLETPLP